MTENSAPPNRPMIYEALAAVMAEIPAIGKDKKNQQQGFNYRGIDDVYNALNPILAKHGVIMIPEVTDRQREERETRNGGVLAFVTLTVGYHFCASDGSSVSCTVIGEGMDSGDKATNKALSIAQKYALFQTFCIPTQDPDLKDPDEEAHKPKPIMPALNSGQPPTAAQLKAFHATMREVYHGLASNRAGMIEALGMMYGRQIASSKDLTSKEVSRLIDDPGQLRQYIVTHRADQPGNGAAHV